jgi:DNA invertase Pin-like site-specific DNA recombinase
MLPQHQRSQSSDRRQITFEDLKSLRAEGYIRDSTLDQRDGFGPDIQRHNIQRFAQSYGLNLGERWYTEFVSGRRAKKRRVFQQFIEDAYLDAYDVLLVDYTSRFDRNQEECIRFKSELQKLGKVVIFVSQGIISGSDRDFLSERINETLDEQYSRNLSRYVTAGMAEKAAQGYANGAPPLGYRSQLLSSGRREQKVPDPETLPALLALLQGYASGNHSYQSLSDELNSQGYRTRLGEPFTLGAVKSVLDNPFYEGKVFFQRGKPDEIVVAGTHEVPPEVKEWWLKCQEVKSQRRGGARPELRKGDRSYPLSKILHCHSCGSPYHGEAVVAKPGTYLVLSHDRRDEARHCQCKPKPQRVKDLVEQFGQRVVPQMVLNPQWQNWIIAALKQEGPLAPDRPEQAARIEQALSNLRKQHLWGDLNDEEYRSERLGLERQLRLIAPQEVEIKIPNLERAAELLGQMNTLWCHPGESDQQREGLVKEVFESVTIEGRNLMSVEPKPQYVPLFASIVLAQQDGSRESKPTLAPPETRNWFTIALAEGEGFFVIGNLTTALYQSGTCP